MPVKKPLPVERLIELHENLIHHAAYSSERRNEFVKIAEQFKISEYTVRRQYNNWIRINLKGRSDKGHAKVASNKEIEEWVSMIAAIQIASLNKKKHMCSTRRAIELLEDGILVNEKSFEIPKGKLIVSTANRWLRTLRIRKGKHFTHVVPIHFRAEYSNELWHADVSPSDAQYFGDRMRSDKKKPHFYAVVDDHSSVVYAEYRETRDEDVQAGLEVIYNAMAAKKDASFPFQGIPDCFYFDPGRIGRSPLVNKILEEKLGSVVKVHQSDKATGKLVKASRAKGKIERSFLILKEDFESLFHFHRPRNVNEANDWLFKYLLTFNSRPHPEPGFEGTRLETWIKGLKDNQFRKVCNEDTFWTYVSEPELYTVGPDARIIMGNKSVYVVNPDLAGERVEVWYAADNQSLFVKDTHEKVHGPYPVALRPLQAGTFKQHKKTERDKLLDHIVSLSQSISIPQESIFADRRSPEQKESTYQLHSIPFRGPEPYTTQPFSTIRDFYQSFFDWFKKPFGALPEDVQAELECAYEEVKEPDELWRKSQTILRNHKLVR